MTRDEIYKLEPGEPLDRIMLKSVYGLDPQEGDTIPPFSTSDSDAILLGQFVASSLPELYTLTIHWNPITRHWLVWFGDTEKMAAKTTLSQAICIAALLEITPEES